MSIRFDAAGDYLYRTSDLPSVDPVTISCWIYISVDTNAGAVIAQLVNGAGTAYENVALWATNGTTLRNNTSSGSGNGTDLSTSTWYHVTYTRSGSSNHVYLNGVSDITLTANPSITASYLLIGSNSVEGLNGRIAHIKIWNAELTEAESLAEKACITPVRTSNLYAWYPTKSGSGRTDDYSGNTRHFSVAGSLADEADPGIPWDLIDATGGLTPSGAIIKNPRKVPAGSLTPTGATIKQAAKTFAGGLTPSGVLTAVKTALVSVSGSLTPTGTLVRSASKSLAGALTPTGALLKSTAKTFAGSLTPTGAALKQTAKTFAGSLTPGGVLAAAKIALVSVAGALVPSGTLVRSAGKTLVGSLIPTGALVRSASKVLTGAITPTGALLRNIGKILVGALTPSGSASGSKSASAPSIVSGYTEAGNASNSTTLVINTPTHADGDKIYIVYVTDADSPTTASPSGSGWTTLEGPQDVSSSSVSTAGVTYIWYKTAASEGGSYTITASNSERAVAIAFAVDNDNGIDAEATYAAGTDTSAEVGAVTTTVANTLRISVVVSQGVRTVSTLTGHTLLATHSYTSAGTISVQYKTVASIGADSGQTATLDTGGWGSHAWAIKPSTGTNYTASLSGALAPVGALFRDGRKVVVGSITPTGATLKRAAKSAGGLLDFVGEIGNSPGKVTKRITKTFSGSLTPTGAILKRIGKVLSGVLGLSGNGVGLIPGTIFHVTVTDTSPTELTLVDASVTLLTTTDAVASELTTMDGTT